MIKVLGYRRVLILVILVAVNIVLGGAAYLLLEPIAAEAVGEKKSSLASISKLQAETANLRLEFDQIDDSKAYFNEIKNKGFFADQNRRDAELLVQELQESSGVIASEISIGSGSLETRSDLSSVGYELLVSPVKIKLSVSNDLDVFRYMNLVQDSFPGHVTFKSLDIDRVMELSSATLRALSSDKKPIIVVADLQLEWSTLVPKKDDGDE